MNIKMNNGNITVNGKSFKGNNVSIINGKVIVDGKEQAEFVDQQIKVEVHGDVEKIESESGDIKCHNVGNISTQSGDVECDHISGNVSTMSGDVHAECGIEGNVSTMSGDISGR